MIRDPSDGSVREAPKIEVGIPTTLETGIPASGLREPSKRGDVQARLEASREWLKTYFQRKTAE